jgi:hypothetical protein
MNVLSEDAKNRGSVPIFLYETNQVTKKFEQLSFQLAQSEDERIVVDQSAKSLDANQQKSNVSTNLVSNINALKILQKKIVFLVEIFKNSPEVSQKPEYLRRLNQICK